MRSAERAAVRAGTRVPALLQDAQGAAHRHEQQRPDDHEWRADAVVGSGEWTARGGLSSTALR
jgi:hypothetical protein